MGRLPILDHPVTYRKFLAIKNKSAVSLGRLGGLVKSKAKTEAARLNGKLGGRPKKKRDRSKLKTAQKHFSLNS